MSFCERLRSARIAKGYTQEQLAKIIGVAKSTLTGYEKGNREPDVLKIHALATALEITGDELLGIDKKPKDSPSIRFETNDEFWNNLSSKYPLDEIAQKTIKCFLKLSEKQQAIFYDFLEKMVDELNTPHAPNAIDVYRVANSSTNKDHEIVRETSEEMERLRNLPTVTRIEDF